MQDDKPEDHLIFDPRTMEVYEAINEAADGLLAHCKDHIRKPYIAIFGMLMAASRIGAAANLDPKLLHQALNAMYDDSLVAERELRGDH